MPQDLIQLTMKNLREELIKYEIKTYNKTDKQAEFWIDSYLSIINFSQRSDETKAVRQNEQTQEVCISCKSANKYKNSEHCKACLLYSET